MSSVSAPQDNFDFWEFVNCARCQLPFSQAGAVLPFWLTECGHVICNSHLSADQSCPQCGAQAIQLVPLQREMDAPMSDWFLSVPGALDTLAYAVRYQQGTLASQIRLYKARYHHQRAFIERLKYDALDLKKANEALVEENGRFRQQLGIQPHYGGRDDDQAPAGVVNSNGKRQMVEGQQYDHEDTRPRTHSSPLIVTPLGPDRLTLPSGQPGPILSSNRHDIQSDGSGSLQHDRTAIYRHGMHEPQQRPGSSQLAKHYSYIPSTPRFHPPRLTHTQAAPRVFQRTRTDQEQQQPQVHSQAHGQRMMLPSAGVPGLKSPPGPIPGNTNKARTSRAQPQKRSGMGPPPIPQHLPPQAAPTHNVQANVNMNHSHTPLPTTNRFLHPAQRFAPSPSAIQNQRFMPPTTSSGSAQRGLGSRTMSTSASRSRASSQAAVPSTSGGTQRMPFVPGAQGGFG